MDARTRHVAPDRSSVARRYPGRRSVAGLAAVAVALLGVVSPSVAVPGDRSSSPRTDDADTRSLVITDVNPDPGKGNPGAGAGGRINGLTAASDGITFYAASEWGGLYKSRDRGRSWWRLTGHLPTVTWDVEVDPRNDRVVYATSFFDGRVSGESRSGIQISRSAGEAWGRPPSAARPPDGYACPRDRRDEPSAFGIAADPAGRRYRGDVYIGTNCGLAITHDAGRTWRWVNPRGEGVAPVITDVVATRGIVDVCGTSGHWRSRNAGATWRRPARGRRALPDAPALLCSMAASPDDRDVMFASVGLTIYETVDGGRSWRFLDGRRNNNPSPMGRIPFIATNNRTRGFDLWFGDVSLHRRPCRRPSRARRTWCPRVSTRDGWYGKFIRETGAHEDSGDLAFDRRRRVDRCPALFSSDGGVYFNTTRVPGRCQGPRWREALSPPHAWWVYAMAGFHREGVAEEDLYVGLQDNGLWGHNAIGAPSPQASWNEPGSCCDAHDVDTDGEAVFFTFYKPALNQTCRALGTTGCGPITANPPGTPYLFTHEPAIARYGRGQFLMATNAGIYLGSSIEPTRTEQVQWSKVGDTPTPNGFCSVRVSQSLRIYADDGCDKDVRKGIWVLDGGGSTFRRLPTPFTGGGFGLWAVHPDSPLLYASWIPDATNTTSGVTMLVSRDGGDTWTIDVGLTSALLGDAMRVGRASYRSRPSQVVPRRGRYTQPSLIAFDPEDPDVIVVGGEDSGLFITSNAGEDWAPLRVGAIPSERVPRPFHAYFDHEPGEDAPTLYVGTMGVGVWRFALVTADLSLDHMDAPVIAPGGITRLTRTVRNTRNLPNEVTVYQELPPRAVFDQQASSSTCVLGFDRAVRCSAGYLGPAGTRTFEIAVTAVDDGNQSEDCVDRTVEARAYSNALEASLEDNAETTVVTVCT